MIYAEKDDKVQTAFLYLLNHAFNRETKDDFGANLRYSHQ